MNHDRVALAAFVGNSLLAGGNAVAIRFSNRELDPMWGAGLRFSLAAALLAAVMAVMRLQLPRGRALTGALLFGTLNFGGAFGLAYYALVELHAGFGQILLALVPLATLLLAVVEREEPFRVATLVGALVSLTGIAVMSRAPLREAVPALSVLAAVGSALCFAQAAVLVRRFPRVHPITMNAVGMTAGAVMLLIASTLVGEPIELPQRAETWAALGYVVVVGSVLVFLLYLVVLGRWSASQAAYVFVLIPFVTVALSAWLDDEPLGTSLVLGGLVVLTGVYVGALRPASAETATTRVSYCTPHASRHGGAVRHSSAARSPSCSGSGFPNNQLQPRRFRFAEAVAQRGPRGVARRCLIHCSTLVQEGRTRAALPRLYRLTRCEGAMQRCAGPPNRR